MFRVAVLISGRGSNLGALIRAAANQSYEICGVISDKAEAGGLSLARENLIPTFVIERKKEERTLTEFFQEISNKLHEINPDLVVLAGFMRILPSQMIQQFERRMINIHPSLLPDFKGMNAQKQALLAGVSKTGCTVHYVVGDVDAGEIIAQSEVPILATDTEETLTLRILEAEHRLLPQVVAELAIKHQTENPNGN